MRDDQATGLRRLFANPVAPHLCIGGAEPTAVSCDLALAMAELGARVLIIDRTRGEAAARLALRARFELADVMAGDLAIGGVLLDGPAGVCVLPAARGLDELALAATAGSDDWAARLASRLHGAGRSFDLWLVNGLPPTGSDADVLLAIRPTAAAVIGAYAQIKALATMRGQRTFGVVVDRAASERAAEATFAGLAQTARRFLSAELAYRGHVPAAASASPRRRQAFLHLAHALHPRLAHA